MTGNLNARADPEKARVFEYRPPKYFVDYAVTGFNNSVSEHDISPMAEAEPDQLMEMISTV